MGSRSWQIGQTQQLLLRSLGGALWVIRSHDTWSYWHYPAFLVLCCLGLEVWTGLAHVLGTARRAWLIPARGKHLDSFETVDYLCIAHNKVFTSLFTYHLLQFTQRGPFEWALDKLSCTNFLGGVVALFLVYDFFYTLFHMFLHHRSVYKYVHKHHHRQKAPSRGNSDAVNVHPFEFVTGEYNHLAAAYLVSRIMPVHALAVWTFVLLGGFAASLNHTRFDLKLPIFPSLFQVKYHDIHHWYPDCNYGQYSVLWDKVFGSFKPYPDDGLDSRAGGDFRTAAKETKSQ